MNGKLNGKVILFLGSSVTEGSGTNGVSFADVLAEQEGIVMFKEAVGGTTLAGDSDSTYVARMKHGRLPADVKADALVCQLSTNDVWQNFPLDQVEAAIREIVRYTRATWGCKIFFYTGTRFASEQYNSMVNLLHALAAELDFEILDLWNDPEMLAVDPADYARYMEPDGVHPRLEGYREWWTPKFEAFLAERV